MTIRTEPVPSLFDDQRMSYIETLDLSIASLTAYGALYDNWVIAYSGGKDSSATVGFVVWAIKTGKVPPPKTLTVLYADTGMELPPLQITAMKLLEAVQADGYNTKIVKPEMDKRFFVYILGRGIPPPTNMRRWCTRTLKADPMSVAMKQLEAQHGEFLTITGVRTGESAARDNRISMSCSKDGGECGQGWFQQHKNALAPLVHWRVCYIWKWLSSEQQPYVLSEGIKAVYKADDFVDVRTGCIKCKIVHEDKSFKYLIRIPEWSYLAPLDDLESVYEDMHLSKWRKRKLIPYVKADGDLSNSSGSLGPLTMEARRHFLDRVLDIQRRANHTLITSDEEARIHELWMLNTWPERWDGTESNGDLLYEKIQVLADGKTTIAQLMLPGMLALNDAR